MPEQVRFPEISLFQGELEPMRLEADVQDLEVIDGEVPQTLNGTLYRAGPETQYPRPPGGTGGASTCRSPTKSTSTARE